jgi:glc operon protein GlcG
MISKSSLDFAEAGRALAACRDAAAEHQVRVSIAIVDEAGQLLQFGRMDGARAYTAELASRKARTAASVGIATSIITEMSWHSPGPASEAAVGAGGVPILHEHKCIGAIGVSGAKPEIDDLIAVAGASSWS